jgi:hypothetical protein
MKRWQLLPRREVRTSMTNGERIFDQRFGVLPSRRFEYAIEVVWPSHLQGLNLYPQYSAGSDLAIRCVGGIITVGLDPILRHTSNPIRGSKADFVTVLPKISIGT